MKNILGVAVLMVIVGGIVGYGIGMYNVQTATQSAYSQGMAYQASVTPTVAGVPASLDVSWDDDEFDHSATVDADGAVPAEVDVFNTITIENTDETKTATGVYLMLWSPVSQKEGLDDELEVAETYVFVEIGGLSKAIYNDEEYGNGYLIGDLAPGDKIEIEVHITLEEADEDTYVDGETYDCSMYVYQPNVPYVDPVDFTVLT
jgi:hypothetical protein